MSLKIYHQVGHNSIWNTESLTADKVGDGLILSPVHQPIGIIENLDPAVKSLSLFDPQYYLPNSQKKKLKTYPFFPETISNGFSTSEFHTVAHISAESCIDFQLEQGFEAIVIPCRYIDQMKTNYFEQQEEYTLKPFLKVLNSKAVPKPIFATLALTSHMIEDSGFRTKVLNWITSFPEITGVYLLTSLERDSKQIRSKDFLESHLAFLRTLRNVGLEVIVGHTNTESLLYSLVEGVQLTFGSFENTRIFSIDKFVEIEEDRRGPKARIYLPNLLNWIQFSQAQDIKKANPSLWADIYTATTYSDSAMAALLEPTFNQSPLYKHHFICFYNQVKQLAPLSSMERYELISEWIRMAKINYSRIRTIGVTVENHGNGNHLDPWAAAIDSYKKKYLKP